MDLTPSIQSFVMHFGEMGSRWGMNRTVSQIYALLMTSEQPLNADQIVETLGISRSNVSMGLKELQSWNLLRQHNIAGDRKDYYGTPDDIWEITRTLIEERRKREIDPTLSMLRNLLMKEPANASEQYAHQRFEDIHNMIEMVTAWSNDMQRLNSDSLAQLMKLGAGVSKVLDIKDKIAGKRS
ncbi:GbsR/MarR family transcriptional regulator [Porticoccus sp. W117]|uniref:GbsR/MarR family transcriptional regulator n=1 Tax=Porticoccus sp. W117 TaxID=3054777 RepID=UPI0025999D3D|nr:GbsR/MarR family transcriptional regulator [Porticoccus sp. W117]MDM3869766.1 GbsR/MarR family transcriptional regulator [Porticoccus sp. W117]